ncbi:MAG TPA: hypothetical protein VD903_20230 [Pseudonocardia sp.]|nr:hypothetical protein [Pseudonocardia sp.]
MTLAVRIVGVVLAAAFALAGLVAASALLPMMVVVGLLTGLLTYNALQDGAAARARPAHRRRALAALTAGGAVAGTYVVIGMVVLLGGALAATLCGVALVPVAYRVLRRRRTAAEPQPEPAPATEATHHRPPSPTLLPADPATATVPELCRAWRISYLVLENTRDAARLAEVAAARRAYLDELDRRDPHGFRRWLDDGARAAGDPARYIRARSNPAARQDDAAA